MHSRPAARLAKAWASVDWRLLLMLPPQRRFTPEELRRAVPHAYTGAFKLGVALHVALPGMLFVLLLVGQVSWVALAALLLLLALLTALGLAAWADPGSRWAWAGLWLLPLAALLLVQGLRWHVGLDPLAAKAMGITLGMGTVALWFVIVHRHQHVAMRLAELDERARAVDMARRLAAAQLAPHFLFNTLASVQHWVHTGDARAGPLLDALTGYLRATLPLFDRPLLPLADELEAVRRYLQVMQARLGRARLAWRIDVAPELAGMLLPPGLLLTLVENAVVHGIEPQLSGGVLLLRAQPEADGRLRLQVQDNGPGPAPGMTEGVGLRNVRERLALLHGPTATLRLAPALDGGTLAEVCLPPPSPRPAVPPQP